MAWAATDVRAHGVAGAPRARALADRSAWVAAGMAGLTLTALVPLWIATPLPLQDLPNHLLKVDLLQRLMAGDPQAGAVYEMNLRPVPNLACYWVILALSPVMGLVTAARVFLSLCVVALCVATFVLVRRVNPENGIVALVAPGIVYTDFLSKGFLNFTLALPLYVAGLVMLASPGRPVRPAWLCLLATALYFTHGFVFLALCGAAVGLAVLMRLPAREAAVRLCCFVPSAVLFAVWLRGGVGGPQADAAAAAFLGSPSVATWDALGWTLGAAYGSVPAACWLVAVAVLAACTVAQLIGDPRGARRLPLGPREALLVLGLMMVVAFYATSGASAPNVSVRFVPLAILTVLGGLRAPRATGLRAALATLLVASTLGLHARNADAYVRRGADVAEYVRGMEAMQPGASVLPIDLSRQPAGSRVNLHAWAYYHLDRGGWGPHVHALRSQHPIAFRARPWGPSELAEDDWFAPETERRAAACYDYVVVWGGDDGAFARLEREFVRVHSAGRLHVFENRAGVRRRPPAAVPECLAEAP